MAAASAATGRPDGGCGWLLKQYAAVRAQQGLDYDALAGLAGDAIRGSAAPPEVRARLLAGIGFWRSGAG